jgi:hypothetical protein
MGNPMKMSAVLALLSPVISLTLLTCESASASTPVRPRAAAPHAANPRPTPRPTFNADNCIDGQDLNAEDIDISHCPAIPNTPNPVDLGVNGPAIDLGAWEIGTTAEGQNYKYGSLSTPKESELRTLTFAEGGGATHVNEANITCWAKGYYRLRKILENPPADYIKLYEHHFQVRFFQFQTDLRNGPTGFREISSYMDHLVKWVTVIQPDGSCNQPTLSEFQSYLANEVARRGL